MTPQELETARVRRVLDNPVLLIHLARDVRDREVTDPDNLITRVLGEITDPDLCEEVYQAVQAINR